MAKGNAVLLGAVIVAVLAAFIIVGSIPVEKFVDDYGTDYGAVLVLNFEEGIGYIAFDQSPYGNDGDFTPANGKSPLAGGDETLFVDSFTGDLIDWDTEQGDPPYLNDNYDNWIHETRTNGATEGYFGFQDTSAIGTINSVTLYIECFGGDTDEQINVYIDSNDGSGYDLEGTIIVDQLNYAYEILICSSLDTWAEINFASMVLEYVIGGKANDVWVRRAYLQIDYTAEGGEGGGNPDGAPTWTTGKYGSALLFSTDDSITVGNVTTTLRTLESWVYLDTTTEPLFELSAGVNISVIAGTLTATGFAGTTTLYVDGAVASTVTAATWHYIAVTSGKNEDCTAFVIGKVGAEYLDSKVDQLRIYTEEKTLGEIRNHYLNSGHMYSGSVIVSDDFRILNSTLDERINLDDGGLDLNHYYIINSDFSHWIHFSMEAGMTDESINVVPSGLLIQDRHFHRITFAVDTAPGAGKECNITLTDGVGSMSVSLTEAETSGWTDTGEFDWDVSATTLILKYTQDAGGLAEKGFITIKYHYKVTP